MSGGLLNRTRALAPLPLAGRLAVVTGSLGKLGPVWVRALAGAGADVIGIDLRGADAEEPGEVTSGPGSYRHMSADVTDRARLDELRNEVAVQAGVPSVVVCSAGIDQPPDAKAATWRIEDVDSKDFRTTVDVNLLGTFHTLQVFGTEMARRGGGSIITIGSLYASIAPDPTLYEHLDVDPPFLKPPAYGASKAGVLSLMRYFARLWGPRAVRVNALSPGGVTGGQDPEFLRKYCARVPLRRMAEPADLTGPLIFLASDASRYLTGHELRVDGGFTA